LVKIEVDALTSASNINIGRSDISKTILKWVAGILASIIIYQATRGM